MGLLVPGVRVLVTGSRGFLGSRVCKELRRVGVTDLITPSRSELDLTDQRATHDFVGEVQPNIVVNLAAEVGGIGANRLNPGRYFYANMAMGLHLIEASRIHAVTKVVQVGTVCAYPKHAPIPFREENLWNGYPEETNAPYGIAKKALLVMLQAYRNQYGLNGIYLLPANLYGPGDNFDPGTSHVIPALIRRFVEARDAGHAEVEVWGSGTPTREFLHVRDASRGIVMGIDLYDGHEPVNLGSGMEVRISELADTIARLVGYRGAIQFNPAYPDGQPRRALDVTRAKERFGFEASTPLEAGLRETIEWWESSRE